MCLAGPRPRLTHRTLGGGGDGNGGDSLSRCAGRGGTRRTGPAVTAPPMTDRVTLRVLGPVEAVVDGRPLDIGPRQRRAVLAALAVDAGTPVPIDALADRVWGGTAPDAPRSALYAHV